MIEHKPANPKKNQFWFTDKPFSVQTNLRNKTRFFGKSIWIFDKPSLTQQTFKTHFGFYRIARFMMVYQKKFINQFFFVCVIILSVKVMCNVVIVFQLMARCST